MKYFARLLVELKHLTKKHQPGEALSPPSLLSHTLINGNRLSYFQMGLKHEGPPVVFLHGFGGFFMDWPRIMAPVAKKYRTFAVDLPGWGFSEFHKPSYSGGIAADAKVLDRFLDNLGLNNALIVGHSYGAAIAWSYASMGFSRAKKLLLLNPMPPQPSRFMKSMLFRSMFLLNSSVWSAKFSNRLMSKHTYLAICKETVRHKRLISGFFVDLGFLVNKQPWIHQNLYRQAEESRNLDWTQWEKQIRKIEIPTKILHGKQDRIFDCRASHFLSNLIPKSQLELVDDCGHAIAFDQHNLVAHKIMALLNEK
jgi:pimeloyl-ACP methyl ester carboxylesterase